MSEDEVPVEGVTALDHTADVGLEIEAPDQAELMVRAARGMDWLLREAAPPDEGEEEPLSVEASDPAALLRACLAELLYRCETGGLALVDLEVDDVEPTRLEARAILAPTPADPVREIKGVTLHGLEAEERDGRWRGRVIFDV